MAKPSARSAAAREKGKLTTMRVWTGAVRTTDAAEYAADLQATGLNSYGETPGNRGA